MSVCTNVSEIYDVDDYEVGVLGEDPHYQTALQVALDEIRKVKRCFRILEIGGGTGLFTVRLANSFLNARITVIEPDEEWLGVLKRKTAAFPNIACRRTTIEDFTPKEVYDVCSASLAFHHIAYENQRDAVKKVFSLLRPGGIFIVLDKFIPHFEDEYERVAGLKTSHGYFLTWKKQRNLWKGVDFEITSLKSNLSNTGDYKISPDVFERKISGFFRLINKIRITPLQLEPECVARIYPDLLEAGFSVDDYDEMMIRHNLESSNWGTFVYVLQKL